MRKLIAVLAVLAANIALASECKFTSQPITVIVPDYLVLAAVPDTDPFFLIEFDWGFAGAGTMSELTMFGDQTTAQPGIKLTIIWGFPYDSFNTALWTGMQTGPAGAAMFYALSFAPDGSVPLHHFRIEGNRQRCQARLSVDGISIGSWSGECSAPGTEIVWSGGLTNLTVSSAKKCGMDGYGR